MWGQLRVLKQLLGDGEIDSQHFRQQWAQSVWTSYVVHLMATLHQRLGLVETVDGAVEGS